MAHIFAILTSVLLLGSAFLAYKNHEAYKTEIDNRVEAEGVLQREQARLTAATTDRDQTIADRTATEKDTAEKQEQQALAEASNTKLKQDIKTKQDQVQENDVRIAEIENQTKELGDISEIAPRIQRLGNQITDLRDDKDAKQVVRANTMAELKSTQSTIDGYVDQNSKVSRKESYFDSTRIRAIFPNYGFVTLSAGNGAGVVAGSTLDVVRSSEVIAKLRVRTVEANTAAADVVPDSMKEDVVLMVGDMVKPSASSGPAPGVAKGGAGAPATKDSATLDDDDDDAEEGGGAQEEKSGGDDIFDNGNANGDVFDSQGKEEPSDDPFQ